MTPPALGRAKVGGEPQRSGWGGGALLWVAVRLSKNCCRCDEELWGLVREATRYCSIDKRGISRQKPSSVVGFFLVTYREERAFLLGR